MDGTRISEVFKGLGKLIRLAEIGAADASGVRSHMLAVTQQFAAQAGGDYDDIIQVVIPLHTRMQPAVSTLDRVAGYAKAAVQSYVRAIGPELNQPPTASTTAILTTLKARMEASGQTIAPSGAFWNYFQRDFGFSAFPASDTPTILDGWVGSVVIV